MTLGCPAGIIATLAGWVPPVCTQVIAIGRPVESVAEALRNTNATVGTVSVAPGYTVITGGAGGPVTVTAPTTGSPEQCVAAKFGVGIGGAQGAGSSWRTSGPLLPAVGVLRGPEPQ